MLDLNIANATLLGAVGPISKASAQAPPCMTTSSMAPQSGPNEQGAPRSARRNNAPARTTSMSQLRVERRQLQARRNPGRRSRPAADMAFELTDSSDRDEEGFPSQVTMRRNPGRRSRPVPQNVTFQLIDSSDDNNEDLQDLGSMRQRPLPPAEPLRRIQVNIDLTGLPRIANGIAIRTRQATVGDVLSVLAVGNMLKLLPEQDDANQLKSMEMVSTMALTTRWMRHGTRTELIMSNLPVFRSGTKR